ncbi:MAG TPA: ATP-binding protein [Actinomycetota bacterium]
MAQARGEYPLIDELYDRLPDGVVVVGADGGIVTLNRVAERLTGWRREEARGRPYGEVLRIRDGAGILVHEYADPFVHAPPLANGSPERTYKLYRRDGSERWVALRAAYKRDAHGAIEQIIATTRDISRRRGAEQSAYELIATLAHDLRSPLTSVKGFTSTILRNWDRFGEDQKKHMLTTIEWDANRMNRLLTDLLNVARLESGRLELRREEIDVASIAATVAERVALEAENHRIELDFPVGFPKVMADPGKVEQVLVNLVENAVRHGDPGTITVSGVTEDDRIAVRVTDVGPGIDERHIPYVFKKFYRRSAGERHKGTGLGLYICRGIVEAHGGEIKVERSGPDGTTFKLTLPVEV